MIRSLILTILVFYSVGGYTSSMFSVQNTKCGKYIIDMFGITPQYLCIDYESVYVCTSPKPPFGAKLPESFFKDLEIQKSNMLESLTNRCHKLESRTPSTGKNCSKSDHPLFQPFIDRLGLPLHTCFCSLDGASVLSVCTFSNGIWQSSAEFDSNRIQKDLNQICNDQTDENYKIACFCNKHSGSNLSDYMDCLKTQTTQKFQEDQSLKNINPLKGIR